MSYRVGNAPVSWGVETGDDPRNPAWQKVLDETVAAGYRGTELGPLGYMPIDEALLRDQLNQRDLDLTAAVLFQPFHDKSARQPVLDNARTTAALISALGAKQLVLIDRVSDARSVTAGREAEARPLDDADWNAMVETIRQICTLARDEFGLTTSIHAHAACYIEFESELERLLADIEPGLLSLCVDTGHSHYAGYDPIALTRRYGSRVSYVHVKDLDHEVHPHVIANKVSFYDACAQNVFCPLGQGAVDFAAFKDVLAEIGFEGWLTVEQDCDPEGDTSPLADAKSSLTFLKSSALAA
ncbi:MAG: TIM barrel protein [Pseudomonadota bacterium]